MTSARRLISGPVGGAAAVVAVLLVASWLFILNFNGLARQAMPDTYWYARQAVVYNGAGTAHADEVASRIECTAVNRYARQQAIQQDRHGALQTCHHYPTHQANPRYARIFTTRPGFSLLAAPLVGLAGPWLGMEWATAIASVLVALLLYAAVRAVGGSRIAGIGSAVLLYLLPTGYWTTRMLPEGAMLAGCLATGIGIMLLWPRLTGGPVTGAGGSEVSPGRARIGGGIALAAAGLVWTYVIKSANGFLLSAVLLAGGAVLAGWARARRQARWRARAGWPASAAVMALVGLAGTLGWLVVSRFAHLPSFSDTIQDMASSHFRRRLSPNPIGYLAGRDTWFIPHWGLVVANDVWPLPVVAVGVAALVWTCRMRSVPWLFVGVTGPLAVAAHPIGSESDRLALPVWLPVAIGLVLGADQAGRWAIRRWIQRRPATASPATAGPTTAGPTTAGPTTAGGAKTGHNTTGHATTGPSTEGPAAARPAGQDGGMTASQLGSGLVAWHSPGSSRNDTISSPPARS